MVVAPKGASRARCLWAALLVVLLVELLVPTLACAAWTAPFDISPGGADSSQPWVAVDPGGDAVFAWGHFDGKHWRIQARGRSAAGVLSGVQTLSPTGGGNALDPDVAVDNTGDAVITWTHFDGKDWRAQARTLSAGGVLSPVQNLSLAGQDAFSPQVAVDDDGDAVFIWYRSDGSNDRVQARARSAAGVLNGIQNLSNAGQDAYPGGLAVDSIGRAVFTWNRYDGVDWRIQGRARSAAGVLSAVQNLSAAGKDAFEPHVGVSDKGNAVFTWWRDDDRGNRRIQARARASGGALSGVQDLSAGGDDADQPAVAVDATGDAVFAWWRSGRIQTRARTSTGTLSAVQDLSAAGESAKDPEVAVDATGDAVFAWAHVFYPYPILARTRSAAGVLGAIQTISPKQAFFPPPAEGQVAVDADGDALIAWENQAALCLNSSCTVVEAVAGP